MSENRKERAAAMLCLGLSLLFIVLIVTAIASEPSNIAPLSLPEPYGMVWDTIGLLSFLLVVSSIVLSVIVLRKPTKQT
ncbi:MAG: hypothetical protein ABSF63_00560 [Candidatus Bathyarchaeia archaeon]